MKRIAAQIRSFPTIRCAIVVPPTDRQAISALYRRRAERIKKFLVEENRIPIERISIKPANVAGNAIVLQLLAGANP